MGVEILFSYVFKADSVGLVGVGKEIVPQDDKASADFASIVSVHRLPHQMDNKLDCLQKSLTTKTTAI